MIKVGCSGWPVSQARYRERLSCIEVATAFENPPMPATAERWRENAPDDFVFALRACRLITHSASSPSYERHPAALSRRELLHCGHFRPTEAVSAAWRKTQEAARAMKARFIVFQTPASFYPSADHLRDLYRFFKATSRERIGYVWEPRGEAWRPEMVRKVCRDLELIHAVDPLAGEPTTAGILYYRMHGGRDGGRTAFAHAFTDAELRHVVERCGQRPAFVFFNNASMWKDALRFDALLRPEAARLRTNYVRHLREF